MCFPVQKLNFLDYRKLRELLDLIISNESFNVLYPLGRSLGHCEPRFSILGEYSFSFVSVYRCLHYFMGTVFIKDNTKTEVFMSYPNI